MIFLSYAHEDASIAKSVFDRLHRRSRPVFFDKDYLLPGMDWRLEIEERLAQCRLFVVILSRNSVAKEGFVQKEIRLALERAEMMPEGSIFIIPVVAGGVTVPRRLRKYQWINVDDEEGLRDLASAIEIVYIRKFGYPLNDPNEAFVELDLTNRGADEFTLSDTLAKDEIVLKIIGNNAGGERMFARVRLTLEELIAMKRATLNQEPVNPRDFGVVLEFRKVHDQQ